MFGTEVGQFVCSAARWRDLGSVGPASSVGPGPPSVDLPPVGLPPVDLPLDPGSPAFAPEGGTRYMRCYGSSRCMSLS